MAAHCSVPFLAIREGSPIPLADGAAVRGHFAAVMDAYRAAGAAATIIVSLDTRALGARAAFSTVRWHALNAEGVALRDFEPTYHLSDGDDGWRLVS